MRIYALFRKRVRGDISLGLVVKASKEAPAMIGMFPGSEGPKGWNFSEGHRAVR
jgi:hypothetical protein